MPNHDDRRLAQHWTDLEAASIPLEPPEFRVGLDARNSGAALTIRPGRDRWRAEIRELKSGRLAYILPIFVRRDRPGKTIIRDAWIAAPWPDSIEMLADPKEGPKPAYYTFPDNAEQFSRNDVLNHRLNRVLARGDILEGLLLGLGSCPPDGFKDQNKIEVMFGILDQWDDELTVKLEMKIRRLPPRAKPVITSTRGPLLSRRDNLPPTRPLVAPLDPATESRQKEAVSDQRISKDVTREHSKPKRAKMPGDSKTHAR
jgi:hypothetical protein